MFFCFHTLLNVLNTGGKTKKRLHTMMHTFSATLLQSALCKQLCLTSFCHALQESPLYFKSTQAAKFCRVNVLEQHHNPLVKEKVCPQILVTSKEIIGS